LLTRLREIKNATRTAQALAFSTQHPLSYDLLKEVLDVVERFDIDFRSAQHNLSRQYQNDVKQGGEVDSVGMEEISLV
jgi:hypothetical protein